MAIIPISLRRLPLLLYHVFIFAWISAVHAHFPPAPENVTVLRSRFNDNITISYKEPGICETTPGVRSYSGYVHLPPGTLGEEDETQDYPINTFFWFFEARKDPTNAPLAIWMNGGPGSSSMLGLLAENGPCRVNPDSNSTELNPWSWNNEVSMLYIDQPVQTGFSYSKLVNVTRNLLTGRTEIINNTMPPPMNSTNPNTNNTITNATVLLGTLTDPNPNITSRNSRVAAAALWHFAQVWLREFPGYRPNNSRIAITTESYGGRYGPEFSVYFQRQNERIRNGSLSGGGASADDDDLDLDDEDNTNQDAQYIPLNLDTLLIINGCVDEATKWLANARMAYNNTYNIQLINETAYSKYMRAYTSAGGCLDQLAACQSLLSQNPGPNATVSSLCNLVAQNCGGGRAGGLDDAFDAAGRNGYDITQLEPDPFPSSFHYGYLNQPHVQRALGVPLNWTSQSPAVNNAFGRASDYLRPGTLEDMAYLLDQGNVRVNLMYGDRDYVCNWFGGEAVSTSILHAGADSFRSAGYASVVIDNTTLPSSMPGNDNGTPTNTNTTTTFIGGQVREAGNLSFVRVFQAGHTVPSYQPETAYHIFMRVMRGLDIATGTIDVVTGGSTNNQQSDNPNPPSFYSTQGPPDTLSIRDAPPPQHRHYCYLLDRSTCTRQQLANASSSGAQYRSFILVDSNSSALFPNVVGGASSNSSNTPSQNSTATTRPGVAGPTMASNATGTGTGSVGGGKTATATTMRPSATLISRGDKTLRAPRAELWELFVLPVLVAAMVLF